MIVTKTISIYCGTGETAEKKAEALSTLSQVSEKTLLLLASCKLDALEAKLNSPLVKMAITGLKK